MKAARLLAPVAGMVLVAACKSSPPELSDGGARPTSAAAPSPDSVKTVSRDDCKRWAEHSITVVLTEWKASASACPEADRKALADKLDGQMVSVRTAAETVCAQHVGETYGAAGAKCYLDAGSFRELKSCNFGPMESKDDTDMTAVFEQQRATCAKQGGGPKPATSI